MKEKDNAIVGIYDFTYKPYALGDILIFLKKASMY